MGATFRLSARNWQLDDERLGDGGFGDVFTGHDVDTNELVAIKLVAKTSGASRELLFADANSASGFANVLPVYDTGEHGDYWVLVMPLASTSLRAHIDAHPEGLDREEALAILTDIAGALSALNGAVVHRDIKPENILLFDGAWHVADFGVSRAADAATAESTRRQHFSAPYAAPEQWQHIHATEATDVYALGVIAFELIEGRRPFDGPSRDDYRDQHVSQPAPTATSADAGLRALINQCLMKAAPSRPLAADVLARLQRAPQQTRTQTQGRSLLAEAFAAEQQQRADAEAAAEQERETTRRREQLQADGRTTYATFPTALRAAIEDAAPGTPFSGSATEWTVMLGTGTLTITAPTPYDVEAGPIHVILAAQIEVRQEPTRGENVGRSHSLWYCNAFDRNHYDWYELAFSPNGLVGHWPTIRPYAQPPGNAAVAFQNIMGTVQLNGPLSKLDPSDPDSFVEAWITRLGQAAAGQLPGVSTLPERHDDRAWQLR